MNILIYMHPIIIREYKTIAFTLNKVIAKKTNLFSTGNYTIKN